VTKGEGSTADEGKVGAKKKHVEVVFGIYAGAVKRRKIEK